MDILLSLIPIALLILLMAVFKQPGDRSSLITLVVTAVIAVFGFGMSFHDMSFSFLYGAPKAISPILVIILFLIIRCTPISIPVTFEAIYRSVSKHPGDRSIQVLLMTWGFGGIL